MPSNNKMQKLALIHLVVSLALSIQEKKMRKYSMVTEWLHLSEKWNLFIAVFIYSVLNTHFNCFSVAFAFQ